jgi:hypothetical protein
MSDRLCLDAEVLGESAAPLPNPFSAIQFTDAEATNAPHRFYRVEVLP